MKLNRTVIVLGLFLMACFGYAMYGSGFQEDDKKFILQGSVMIKKGDSSLSTVTIVKNSSEKKEVKVDRRGKFTLELDFFNEYEITFEHPDHYKKKIAVSTQVPQKVWDEDSDFPPISVVLQLFEKLEFLDDSFTDKPVGKIELLDGDEGWDFGKISYATDKEIKQKITAAKVEYDELTQENEELEKLNLEELRERNKDYTKTIEEAEILYERKEFDAAKAKYKEASSLMPSKSFATDRVAEIDDLVAALDQAEVLKEKAQEEFDKIVEEGDKFAKEKNYIEAKDSYRLALDLMDDDDVRAKLNDMDRKILLAQEQLAYSKVIYTADSAFNVQNFNVARDFYRRAMSMRSEDKYPKQRLSEIDEAEQLKAINAKYEEQIELGDAAFTAEEFDRAIAYYNQALKVKGTEQYPKDKIQEINRIVEQQAQNKKYDDLLAQADQNFDNEQWTRAKTFYSQIVNLRPDDAHSVRRIREIDEIVASKEKVAQLDADYQAFINTADNAYERKNWSSAISAYQQAADLKPEEVYPQDQIGKAKEELRKVAQEDERRREFKALVASGDSSYGQKDFASAKGSYEQALTMYPEDKGVQKKLDSVNRAINLRADKAAKEQRANDKLAAKNQKAYDAAIVRGDKLFVAKQYRDARTAYEQALLLKREEQYPQTKLTEIETILQTLATEKALADKKRIEQEQDRIDKENSAYREAVARADQLMREQRYADARQAYTHASSFGTGGEYVRQQLGEVDKLQGDAYSKAFNSGESSSKEKEYEQALQYYKEALSHKPGDKRATARIKEMDDKLKNKASRKQLEQENRAKYTEIITRADALLAEGKYAEAKVSYERAQELLPKDKYVRKKLEELDELIKDQKEAKKNFDIAIAKATRYMKEKQYEEAMAHVDAALKLFPNDMNALDKKDQLARLLEGQQAVNLKREEYEKYVREGDKFYKTDKLEEAKVEYKKALDIFTYERYPQNQIGKIDRTLRQRADKAYKQAIDKANMLVGFEKYDSAKEKYQEALVAKPNDFYAQQRLAEMDKMIEVAQRKFEDKQRREEQYKKQLAAADQAFDSADYDKAKLLYQQVSLLKPDEDYPQAQLRKIRLLARDAERNEQLTEAFAKAIADGNANLAASQFMAAKTDYREALRIFPDREYPKEQLAKIDSIMLVHQQTKELADKEDKQKRLNEKTNQRSYRVLVNKANVEYRKKHYDEARKMYMEALSFVPDDQFVKGRIDQIDRIIAEAEVIKGREDFLAKEQAKQDSLLQKRNELYDEYLTDAQTALGENQFDQAIAYYKEAINIRSSKKFEVEPLISRAERLKQIFVTNRADYAEAIKKGNAFYKEKELREALAEYRKALEIMPNEEYPKEKVQELSSFLEEQDRAFAQAVRQGALMVDLKKYGEALKSYNLAANIRPDDENIKAKMREIEKLIGERGSVASGSTVTGDTAYDDAIKLADDAMLVNNYVVAKMHYEKASSIRGGEQYPKSQIALIVKQIQRQQKQKALAKQKEIDKNYQKAIDEADRMFATNKYTRAKLYYQKALVIKQKEYYPKDQIRQIDVLLARGTKKQGRARNLWAGETSVSSKIVARMRMVQDDSYEDAIEAADKSFTHEDYPVARYHYYQALSYKPTDRHAVERLDAIRKIVDSKLSSKINDQYDEYLKKADSKLAEKDYTIAKHYYSKALRLKNWEQYPQSQIERIYDQTHKGDDTRSADEYRACIAKADMAYMARELSVARHFYTKALKIRANEEYPNIKLQDIQAALNQGKQNVRNKEYQSILKDADKAFDSKNYSIARFYYQKALKVRPNMDYPKTQLEKVNKIIAEKQKAR